MTNDPDPSDGPAPDATIHVLAFAGSLRSGSYNRALVHAAAESAPEGMRVRTVQLDDIPFYDRDVEREGDPAAVTALKSAIEHADGVLIATPEYQHSIPGVLKNALDWASRPHGRSVLERKPAAIMGATPGRLGTARAQDELRKVLGYNGALVLPQPRLLVRRASEKVDDEGAFVDRATLDRLATLLTHLHAWTRHMAGWTPPPD
jgi:chromate reductase